MKHATTRMLFSYWDALRGERASPERGEIEPGIIRHILADTFILEMNRDRNVFFRLAGTRLCALFNQELKDKPLSHLWGTGDFRDAGRYSEIVTDETAGLVAGIKGHTQKGHSIDLELILLPLRHRGRTHERLIGALSPAQIPAWLGLDPLVKLTTQSLRIIWPSGRPQEPKADQASPLERRRLFVVHRGGRV